MAMSGINDNAMKVLEKRYLAKNEHGEVTEDVSGLFSRVARAVAQADVIEAVPLQRRQRIEPRPQGPDPCVRLAPVGGDR